MRVGGLDQTIGCYALLDARIPLVTSARMSLAGFSQPPFGACSFTKTAILSPTSRCQRPLR